MNIPRLLPVFKGFETPKMKITFLRTYIGMDLYCIFFQYSLPLRFRENSLTCYIIGFPLLLNYYPDVVEIFIWK